MTDRLTRPDSNFAHSLFLYLPRESHFTQITTKYKIMQACQARNSVELTLDQWSTARILPITSTSPSYSQPDWLSQKAKPNERVWTSLRSQKRNTVSDA